MYFFRMVQPLVVWEVTRQDFSAGLGASYMNHPDDQSLVAACLAGDKVAWTSLLDRYERLIYSVPIRYGLSESQASDIFQNVCIILLEHLINHVR